MIAAATHRIALVALGGASWMLAGQAVADPLVGVRSGRPGKLIAESVAESVGMTRAWFTQAALDPTQDEVVGAAVDDDAIYLLASTGTLQAIDRHTGATRWSSRLDPTGSPPFGPSVRAGRVAAVVGAVLHVVDARDGKPAVVDEETGRRVESRRLEAAPGAAPAIGETHVYVPASNGSLMVLAIDPEESLPLRVASP
ncbi:MAG: PQQ-binding-like beta-propeller repeat protein, partial [Planctomycetota bacterium]